MAALSSALAPIFRGRFCDVLLQDRAATPTQFDLGAIASGLGRDPRQYGLDFGLWTRRIVALLIKREFGIRVGVTVVGTLLAKPGLTPQKPLQRAY